MSIDSFLKQLSLEQLIVAREQADRLLNKKMAEPKVLLWVVGNDTIVHAYFIESDYLLAVQRMVDIAGKLTIDDAAHLYEKQLSISTLRVPASEVESYLVMPC